MIEDDDAAMPDGWQENEPTLVPDPTSERPSDWWVNTIRVHSPRNQAIPGKGDFLFPVWQK